MTNAPAMPVPVWWGGVNSAPQALNVCTHQALPPPEAACCADRLLYPFEPASLTWVVNHNRGRTPGSVVVISPFGVVTTARITHTSTNQVVIEHSVPTAGYAILLV